uniref:Pentatricopeptide repeat-containing protein n=1 Tax=Ananas comosus var. bracteatus TaxID=296719 RepID=A0A6V7QL98_ANACO|nr:unnamed protein product [Ananas comosus var. bracteatus]
MIRVVPRPLRRAASVVTKKRFYSSSALSLQFLDAHHLFDSNSAVKIESLYGRHSKVAAFRPNRAPSLFPLVASVVRTLNWGIVRTLRFSEVVDVYGFSHSLESFGMLIGVFASAGRYSQVRCLIKCLVDYDKNVGFSLLELPTILPELSSW